MAKSMTQNWDFDFIVIGGGGAGLSAAITAGCMGVRVMVLEADARLGGATWIAGGVMYAAGTSVQKTQGIDDNADDMFEHVMNLTQWEMPPGLIRLICEESGPTFEWLISLGAVFPPELLTLGGPERVLRAHPSSGEGTRIGDVLVNSAGAENIEHAVNTRVERLLLEDGRVLGVHAAGMDLHAPHVLIATGGFGNNPDMIARLWPSATRHGDRLIAIHNSLPFIMGDGITLGEEVGARIVGYDNGLLLPRTRHLGKREVEDVYLPPWLVLVNREGRRIMDETQPYMISSHILNQQPDLMAFALFDAAALQRTTRDASFDPYKTGQTAAAWGSDILRARIDDGTIFAASTIGDLAKMAGIHQRTLEGTLARYNADCEAGIDSEFGKRTDMRYPIATPPFYASEIRACMIGNTNAGLNIDRQCRVLDQEDRPIPGLYAAGEVLGCVHGRVYAGGGLAIGSAVILGRQAGTVVGQAVRWTRGIA